MAIKTHAKSGGVWREAKNGTGYKSGGVWRTLKNAYYKSGGVWRHVFQGFTLLTGNKSDAVSQIASFVMFKTDGSCTRAGGGSGFDWGSPIIAGIGSNYYVKFHFETGNGVYSGASLDTWHQLTADRQAKINGAGSGVDRDAQVSYIISDSAGGPTLASGTIFLQSTGLL